MPIDAVLILGGHFTGLARMIREGTEATTHFEALGTTIDVTPYSALPSGENKEKVVQFFQICAAQADDAIASLTLPEEAKNLLEAFAQDEQVRDLCEPLRDIFFIVASQTHPNELVQQVLRTRDDILRTYSTQSHAKIERVDSLTTCGRILAKTPYTSIGSSIITNSIVAFSEPSATQIKELEDHLGKDLQTLQQQTEDDHDPAVTESLTLLIEAISRQTAINI